MRLHQLPYEHRHPNAPTGNNTREQAVPCQWCAAVRTFHTSAVCETCRGTKAEDDRSRADHHLETTR